MLLGLDIGGTYTRIAWIQRGAIQEVRVLSTQEIKDPAELLHSYLQEQKAEGIGIGVAGIVNDNQHISLHLPWKLNAHKLTQALRTPVRIVNDVVMLSHAIPHLPSNKIFSITQPLPQQFTRPWMTLAVGTSLGMSWGIPLSSKIIVLPSEIGQTRLFPYAHHKFVERYVQLNGHPPTIENLVSGKGIDQIFSLLCTDSVPEWYQHCTTISERSAQIIAHDGSDKTCTRTLDVFTELLAEFVVETALHGSCMGGIYLFGGIITACRHRLNEDLFTRAREAHPYAPIRQFLNQIPIHGISEPYANLWGIASLFSDSESRSDER